MQGKAHITLVQTYLKYATEIFAEDSALKAKSEALCALKCQAFLTSTLKSDPNARDENSQEILKICFQLDSSSERK